MPELPEVETVRRTLEGALLHKKIVEVEVVEDSIVFGVTPPEAIRESLLGKEVVRLGRKGKTWWIETNSPPVLFGHLGMSGWVRHLGKETIRLKEHGKMPLDDETGRPRFLKLLVTAEDGSRVSLTDGRRLARVWISESPEKDVKVQALGPDAHEALPPEAAFRELFAKRKAPIKALLMDQRILAGIGNWVADEVLYHARIAPNRPANSLQMREYAKLRKAIVMVLELAVDAGADDAKYPEDWLFHYRWGGGKGHQRLGKYELIRETVGGRTTAWIPELQK
jgi:formamidopyrimidine-DNA glycosylase